MQKLIIKEKYGTTPIDILNCTTLSFKAKGLFGYLQSKPDGRVFSSERISKQSSDGRDSVRNGLIELEKHGLLKRAKTRDKKGCFQIDYILNSVISVQDGKPVVGEPVVGKSVGNSNKDFSKIEYSNKENNKLHFLTENDISFLNSLGLSIDYVMNEYKSKKENKHGPLNWSPEKIIILLRDIKNLQAKFGFIPNYSYRTLSLLDQFKNKFLGDWIETIEKETENMIVSGMDLLEYLEFEYPIMSDNRFS